ncbi:tryptophan synthase subunit alpha [Flavisphingomonas formosensis]|uniref:tryptophan synthase subunit alpha n=1 Tax=Flavisphingomonas formosensis TaxID=861534 RepID=UPI0012FBB0B8|nr:tryptophan synthase subunit alpha [Sphingomonas formosensis]
MSRRLTRRFVERRQQGRAALIFYLAAGDPSIALAADMLHAVVAGGADIIELGYPFCDPILDGPVIRLANRRALDAGGSLDATLAIVRRFRARDADTPIVLMGYANPLLSRDGAVFAYIADAGADALIIPDLPLREAAALLPAIAAAGLALVPLVSPDGMTDANLAASPGVGGFSYCVAQAGPTGGAAPDTGQVRAAVAMCRALSDRPVAVGFGIKTPALAAEIAAVADGVIVGSALVDRIRAMGDEDVDAAALFAAIADFCRTFRTAIDGRS